MDHGFDVLEDKVRKAADLVVRLRKENGALEADLGKARARLQEAEKRLTSLEADRPTTGPDAAAMGRELALLQKERDEIRLRLAKIVEILDILD